MVPTYEYRLERIPSAELTGRLTQFGRDGWRLMEREREECLLERVTADPVADEPLRYRPLPPSNDDPGRDADILRRPGHDEQAGSSQSERPKLVRHGDLRLDTIRGGPAKLVPGSDANVELH